MARWRSKRHDEGSKEEGAMSTARWRSEWHNDGGK